MNADFSIKQGDTGPSYYATLTDSGAFAWNLVSASVTFTMRRASDGVVVIPAAPCVVVDNGASSGLKVVRYDWQEGDTDVADLYLADFKVVLANNQEISFPDTWHLLVNVAPAIANDVSTPGPHLVSLTDLDLVVGGLNAAEAEIAMRVIIPRVETEAETFLQHKLLRIERTEIVSVYSDQVEVPLHHTPVHSITAISIDGQALDAADFMPGREGLLLGFPSFFGFGQVTSSASVTYVGGLGPPATDSIRHALLSRIARLVIKFRDDVVGTDSVTAERYLVQYLSEGFEQFEIDVLDPYRSRSGGLVLPSRSLSWDEPFRGAWS